jgi:uncharacterized membrane protein YfcA
MQRWRAVAKVVGVMLACAVVGWFVEALPGAVSGALIGFVIAYLAPRQVRLLRARDGHPGD